MSFDHCHVAALNTKDNNNSGNNNKPDEGECRSTIATWPPSPPIAMRESPPRGAHIAVTATYRASKL